MDNPNVKVRITKRYGKALFATANIKKRSLIADWAAGKTYTAKKASDLPNTPPDFVRDHAIQFYKDKFVDYGGIGRYLAHSCEPNCGFKGRFKIVAMRDIKKGEELTFDYAMSEDSDWRMECKCASKRCRKIVGAFSMLSEGKRRGYGNYISSWLRKKYRI